LRYVDEIWFTNRFEHSFNSHVNKFETGSSIKPPWPPYFEINMTSYFRDGWSDLDESRHRDAEWHADNGGMVEIETGSRIPIWRTFDFPNRK